ncbi:phosphonate ABC transporter ATP-binding protein, partial [Enterococcus faecium]
TDERLEQIYGNAIFEEKAGEIDELERNRSL